MIRILTVLFIFFGIGNFVEAKYTVSGQVNIGPEWQPTIFMAAIDNLSDYYRTSSKLLINTAAIDQNGNFTLVGENLPDEQRYYRLYVMKSDDTEFEACLYGEDHNFVHLILDNNSEVSLVSDENSLSPFGNFNIEGSQENQLMKTLSSIVYPSFYFYKIQFPTELRFSEEKLHSDLKNFADTCNSTLVGLAAINSMDFDNFFENNKDFYLDFQKKMNATIGGTNYAKNYNRKIAYYSGGSLSQSSKWKYLTFSLLCLLGLSMFYIVKLKAKIDKKTTSTELSKTKASIKLTKKEKEILQYIKEGKSNKEIASALFIEVSTVKSHINRLYTKTGVSNREEASNLTLI